MKINLFNQHTSALYIIIDTLEILNRQEMEDRVIDLYYNKKKTYREIEKLVNPHVIFEQS